MENLILLDKIENVNDVESIAASNEQFSTNLYNVLSDEEGNLVMSPISISAGMAMLSTGAEGKTLQQIKTGFFFPSYDTLQRGYEDIIPALRSTDNFTLEVANTVFVQKDFSVIPEFQQILNKSFHASIQMVDFMGDTQEAVKMINNWVEKMTRERIKDIVNEQIVTFLTRMVLVNAIYFKGNWNSKFDSKLTEEKDFFVSSAIPAVKVSMMKQNNEYLWTSLEALSSSMVELPYEGDRIVMQLLLPEEKNKLGELEEKLKNLNVLAMFEKSSYRTNVEIHLPKFRLEQTIPLNDYLVTLGMTDMFIEDVADFSGITGNKDICLSVAIQKVFVEVNEEGTEAAAATAIVTKCYTCPAPSPPKQFIADHPFIFYLRDKMTGMLLFQGRVVNPEERDE